MNSPDVGAITVHYTESSRSWRTVHRHENTGETPEAVWQAARGREGKEEVAGMEARVVGKNRPRQTAVEKISFTLNNNGKVLKAFSREGSNSIAFCKFLLFVVTKRCMECKAGGCCEEIQVPQHFPGPLNGG